MSNTSPVNKVISTAPLRNVQLMLKLADTLINRNVNLPGLGVFSGPSGYGKTIAANNVRNTRRAHLIEVRSYWTQKAFAEGLLNALHVHSTKGTIATMISQATRILGDEPDRLLIVDEADKLIGKGMIDIIRDIYEEAQIPIIMVGEEVLPQMLEAHERTHNRVLSWVLAELCDRRDASNLAKLFCEGIGVHDDLLEEIITQTGGIARRVVTTLNQVNEQARNQGLEQITKALFDGPYFTGRAATRHQRRAK